GPIWYHAKDGSTEELDSTGFPLGMIEDIPYDMSDEYQLESGDILVLGTDGIWEAMNASKEEYGKTRMTEVIKQHTGDSAEVIALAIKDSVLAFSSDSPQRDDITAIVARIT
ncbi:serine/threonine-protein phosphatase, partial [bacterium AH-315-M10]|nr:serine/threonine-protein phosphatase [bacterium AH-315-M10]